MGIAEPSKFLRITKYCDSLTHIESSKISYLTNFFFLQMPFPKHPGIGLPIISHKTSLSFNLPLVLNLDPCERYYFDNPWDNSRKPCFPAFLTQFANYLHSKNLRIQLDDPNLRLRSLDAFLELKHTVEIITGQIQDLQK